MQTSVKGAVLGLKGPQVCVSNPAPLLAGYDFVEHGKGIEQGSVNELNTRSEEEPRQRFP